VLQEIPLTKIIAVRIIGEWSGIRRTGNIAADGGILRQGSGDNYWGAFLNEMVELWSEVLMHAQASMSAGIRLHPSGMEPIVCFEFAPVWHGCPFEVPASRLFCEPCLDHLIILRGVAVAVGPVLVVLLENSETPKWSGFALGSDSHRHYQERPVALHDVGGLITDRDLDLDFFGIHRSGCREIKSSVASGSTSPSGRWRARHRSPAREYNGDNEKYFHE
jgi:hypothetical protein